MRKIIPSLRGAVSDRKKLLKAHENRLQRRAASDGFQITSFYEVVCRHGAFMALLAVLCFISEDARQGLVWLTSKGMQHPGPYLFWTVVLLIIFAVGTKIVDQTMDRTQGLWIFYLFMISLMEEWIFRCALPLWASSFLPYLAGVVLSNALFAIIHYFTLRWKVQRCIFAFLGGMGLSRLLVFEDLFLLIGIHWFATFINTPRPPNGVRS
jgi:uncharacterized protein (DUF2062 family)